MLDNTKYRDVVANALESVTGLTVVKYGNVRDVEQVVYAVCTPGKSPAIMAIEIEQLIFESKNVGAKHKKIVAVMGCQLFYSSVCNTDAESAWSMADEIMNAIIAKISPWCNSSLYDGTIYLENDITIDSLGHIGFSENGPVLQNFKFNFNLISYEVT